MQYVCQLLGITKLNTTAYHLQCDGVVERLNRTLKAKLCKTCAMFVANQYDKACELVIGFLCVSHRLRQESCHDHGEPPISRDDPDVNVDSSKKIFLFGQLSIFACMGQK